MKINCFNCNKEIVVTPSRFKKNKTICCSKKCSGVISSIKYSEKVVVPCMICGVDVHYKQSRFKQIKNHTCSRECSSIMRSNIYKGSANPNSLNLSGLDRFFWDRCKTYQYRSKVKGMGFDLDYEYLRDLYLEQDGKCYYSGLEMSLTGEVKHRTISLDRIDSGGGYTKGNVKFCINPINMLKSDHDIGDIEEIFRSIIMRSDYMLKTRVKKLYDDSILPKKGSEYDAGIDIYVHNVEDKGNYLKIGCGIAIEPEIGKYYMVVPRSSSYKWGLQLYNSVGIIDNLYRGEIFIMMIKTDDFKFTPEKGMRLAQLIPQQQYHIELVESEELSSTERGESGYGSSGK